MGIGHAIGGFFGGSSAAPEQQADSALQAQNSGEYGQSNAYGRTCDESAKAFTKCLDENKGEYQMSICGWYLDQLVSFSPWGMGWFGDGANDWGCRKRARLLLSRTRLDGC